MERADLSSGVDVLLVLNPGSSSLKWCLYRFSALSAADSAAPVAAGQSDVSGIDVVAVLTTIFASHAVRAVIIRVVHGGADFCQPVRITPHNLSALSQLEALAPLHNRLSVALIRQVLDVHGDVLVIAVFDTEFFAALPDVAQAVGLPAALIDKHQLRRYGFHGLAHDALVRLWQVRHPGVDAYRLVTAQLGSGCSMAAIRDGKPMDTTMGFSPNDGLLMRTRSGALDPGLLTWLQQQEGWSPEDADRMLNGESGWRGLSGGTDSMADLFASDAPRDRLAFSLFRYRFRKTLGAYFTVLGGLDGVLLSGGIAEHNVAICRHLLDELPHLGIRLTDDDGGRSLPRNLSSPQSLVQCWIVAADEATSMLRSVQRQFSRLDSVQPLSD